MRELLVEQVPQPRQLVRVAQLVGVDDLVKYRAEATVHRGLVGAAARHLPRTARSARVIVARAGHHLAVPGLSGVLRVLGLAVHRRPVGRVLRPGGGALPLALVLAVGFLAALLLLALRLVVDF